MRRPQPKKGAHKASISGHGFFAFVRNYFLRHAQVMLATLGQMYRTPASNAMTIAVIGIALALPAGLYVLLDNLQQVGAGWDGSASISLFLKGTVSDEDANTLAEQLTGWEQIASVRTITRQQALDEFRELSGFGDTLKVLDENPLPAVLIVQPTDRYIDATTAAALVTELQSLPETDIAQLDLQWVKRFTALMQIGQRGIIIVSMLLALAVIFVVGNTIRLEIQNRRDEIVITKLIGGTNTFIRRPFLYRGVWHGILGASIAWLLIELAYWQLSGPVSRLAGLYQSSFSITTLGLTDVAILMLTGATLGLSGSWLAVSRHLGTMEPN